MPTDIRRPLKKLIPTMVKAQEDNLNEADTVQRLVIFFEEVLGYDPLSEITREKQVKDKYVDLALKVDETIRLLVEAKSAATPLRDRHIEQAKAYAAEANIRWVVLTNGVIWSLYHLEFDEGLEYVRVFSVDLSADPVEKVAEHLALLHRQSIRRGEHEDFWKRHAALDAQSLGRVLYTDSVLRLIRREIRKRAGILVDEEDLAAAFHALFSPEAREKIGPVKIRRRRTPRAEKPQESEPTPPPEPKAQVSTAKG